MANLAYKETVKVTPFVAAVFFGDLSLRIRNDYLQGQVRKCRNEVDLYGMFHTSNSRVVAAEQWIERLPRGLKGELILGSAIMGQDLWFQEFRISDLRKKPREISPRQNRVSFTENVAAPVEVPYYHFDEANGTVYDPVIFGRGNIMGDSWKDFKDATLELANLMCKDRVFKRDLGKMGGFLKKAVDYVKPQNSEENNAIMQAVRSWHLPLELSGKLE